MNDIRFLNEKCQENKRRTLEMCLHAGAGHVTSAFSCAEILTALYYDLMRIDRDNPSWEDRDRFVMSKNHGSVMLYPVLADLGWITQEEAGTFLDDGSRLGMHSKLGTPGIEFSGGSLGIGFGVACGMAYAAKEDDSERIIYVLLGDGECYEGAIWESAMFAAHNKLSNLVVLLDRNGLCITDYTEKMLHLDPFVDKWRAFGWYVAQTNGHDISAIIHTVRQCREENDGGEPICVICDTIKGHGIDFMENKLFVHGVTPRGEWAKKALEQVGGDV